MARLRVLSGREVCRIPVTQGFVRVRQRGSHILMKRTTASDTIVVPVPDHRELAPGTLLSIIKQSGLPRDLFQQE